MAVRTPIYLDHNATTPTDEQVFEAMRPYFCQVFGNAASKGHSFGWEANRAVDRARQQVASLIHASADSILFTSGATESDNLAIKGVARARRSRGKHIITQATEHKAVLDPCKKLAADGFDVTVLPVDRAGRIDLGELDRALRADTILVSIMYANNEIGTIYPMREIGQMCRKRGIVLHTDATQAVGKLPVSVKDDCIDLLSMTAHKIYGPKGCGALFACRNNPCVDIESQLDGGGHENGFRSGTLNVPGIVGLGMCCEIAAKRMSDDAIRLDQLRNRLEHGIMRRLDGVHINGDPKARLPHMTNLSFESVDAESGTMCLEDIAVSSGSACTSACPEPSHVLRACGVPDDLAFSSIRYSLGRSTTSDEIDYTIDRTVELIDNLRALRKLRVG